MGVGHVPARPVCQECEGHDVPRYQHRGIGADLSPVTDRHRKSLGALGERIAARFLADRGAAILGRNIRVGRGELDLIVAVAGRKVAVEVKTAIGDVDPLHQFDDAKAHQVRSLATRLRISRVDYVGVAVCGQRVLVRWLPGAG